MRILLVNKFYYRRGGDCVVTMQTEQLLREHGHEVAIFAMNYADNDPSPWSDYFASEVNFDTQRFKGFERMMGHGDVVKSFKRLLHDFKPDVVHLHNIHSYLSPVVARLAHEHRCRVVWTMHDYKLICPGYTCVRKNAICRACFQRKWNVMIHKCMKDSKVASLGGYIEAKQWNRRKLQRWVDTFICPSHYMAKCLRDAGFKEDKIKVLYNFTSRQRATVETQREDYYCYVGRLSPEKGIDHLLELAAKYPMKLKVAGTGPMEAELHQKYASCQHIEFLGRRPEEEITELLAHAQFSVIPSEWPENNPLSVIESLCLGTPVAGTNNGGIPELIDYTNGFVARPHALMAAIEQTQLQKWDNQAIAQDSLSRFAPEIHYERLMQIYQA